jgi:MFS family permease
MSSDPATTWFFALAFGFAMGADYLLIPLVTAECFGTVALGKILALIIMGYSLGQWAAPWMAGRLFDSYHSYDWAWKILAGASFVRSGCDLQGLRRSTEGLAVSPIRRWRWRIIDARPLPAGSLNDVLPCAGTMDNSRTRIRRSIRVPSFQFPTNNTLH